MFYCPVHIIFGENAMQKGESYIPALGKKALIVSGKTSAKLSGALDDLTNSLKRLGIGYCLFEEITENPILQDVMKGSEIMQKQGCDFVIGIGGGSPIDAAKAISLAAANKLNEDELYFTDQFLSAYPIVAIPTTSGTGTEATQYSVLTDPKTKKKAGFGHNRAFPQLSMLDPRYTTSLPERVTLHTALDALSHLLEGLYSNQRSPMMYPLIFSGIEMIIKHLPIALKDGQNLASRTELMKASLYGGMVIAQSSTTLQHSIGYPLTSEYGVPHGLANAIVMEEIMKLYQPAVKDELNQLFAAINIRKNQFLYWLKSLPFKRQVPISDEFIERAIPQIMASRNMALNPINVSAADIGRILQKLR
ncbi:MAG: iron-containing alcohol dehydrogenase [Candidatus Cloacimonetes bacterium]|nr:iron-containing alcohol dehydrogenase [Candidatus Cloacimonadota bacterium]